MKVIVFGSKPYDQEFLEAANGGRHALKFVEARLTADTVSLADGFDGVCIFVNDQADAEILAKLAGLGIKAIFLRCAGFNNVDLRAAEKNKLCVLRVPAYSPYAVAEHAVGLMLALNRKIHLAHRRVHDGNFALNGLMGFDMHGKTAGVIGTGKIGQIAAKILQGGFGCDVIACDVKENAELIGLGVRYVPLEALLRESDIITLHCPLTPETHHLIGADAINAMRDGVMIINTSRGALVDTAAAIEGLKRGRIGSLGIDVYEEEGDLFFEDLSNQVLQDDVFARLLTFPNVIVTGHQAYFTREALTNIAETTMENLAAIEKDRPSDNAVCCKHMCKRKAN